MFCTECGRGITRDVKFCGGCGNVNTANTEIRSVDKKTSIKESPQKDNDVINTAGGLLISGSGRNVSYLSTWVLCIGIAVGFLILCIFFANAHLQMTSQTNVSNPELIGTWVRRADIPQLDYSEIIVIGDNSFAIVAYRIFGASEFAHFWRYGNREYATSWMSGTLLHSLYRYSSFGTYTVSDNRIEFVFSDGSISTYEFRTTANTLYFPRINRREFIRR